MKVEEGGTGGGNGFAKRIISPVTEKLPFVQKEGHKKDEKAPKECKDAAGIQPEAQGILPLEVRVCAAEARLGGVVGKVFAGSHAEEWA